MENLVDPSFFKNKRIFITGHSGFKGAWLLAVLHEFGAVIKGYALQPDYAGGLFDYINPADVCESIIADIRDRERLFKEIEAFVPDIIFHLAAQPLVRRSYEIPAETFEINVAGTANLLEAASRLKNKCSLVVITTDKVYHNKEEDILYNENDPLGGYDPYSASKACTELVADSFRKSFFNPEKYDTHFKAIATVRAGNVIGGGDWSRDRIIPDIINSLKQNKTIEIRNPEAIRPWQHVLEAIAGYLILARKLSEQPLLYSQAYNFGPLPADHLPVKTLVDKAISMWGSGHWKDISDPGQPHEAGILQLDIKKALEQLGWRPKLHASDAIEWTINWYKVRKEERLAYTFQQIKDYFLL